MDSFLAALHPEDTPGVTELRAISPTAVRAVFVDRVPDAPALADLVRRAAGYNLYVGVAKRRDGTSGKKDNLAGLYALFTDVDFATTPEADARRRLAECPLPPSVIVASGGGLHCYWLLIEPLDAVTERERAESLLRRLAVYVGGDLACAEVARVLRVPGSLNLKYEPARPVVLEHLDLDRNYNASDFEEWLPADPGAPDAARPVTPASDVIPEGTRHTTLLKRLGAARRQGASEAGVRALADAENRLCAPAPLPASEIETLIRSVLGYRPEPSVGVEDVILPAPPAPSVIVFRSAPTICETAPATPDLIVPPYIFAGATVKVDGYPKIGKTTLRNYLIRCALTGHSAFGFATPEKTPVCLLTEEPESALVEGLRCAGLTDFPELHVVTLFDVRGHDWPAIVQAAGQQARTVGARLVWIDTLPALSGLVGDEENSSGAALEVMRPLADLTGAGLAVVLSAHDRKSGGVVGESGRGSSAYAGAVDVIVQVQRTKGCRDTCRTLHAVGRFRDIPPLLTVEMIPFFPDALRGSGLVRRIDPAFTFVRADAGAPSPDDPCRLVAAALPADPALAVTIEDLARTTGLADTTIRRALDSLTAEHRASQAGKGIKGSAFRFYCLSPTPNTGVGRNGSILEDTA